MRILSADAHLAGARSAYVLVAVLFLDPTLDLGLGFGRKDRERMTRLLGKAKSGDISPEQAEVLENYRHVGRLLELMKSRARRSLRNKDAS